MPSARSKSPKKGGAKKSSKKELLVDAASLRPYGVNYRDIITTPLGVEVTVLGVNRVDGLLWVRWPGNVDSPVPSKAKTKHELEDYGYFKRPTSAHIQRSIDERTAAYFNQRYYGGSGPKTASIRLPWPEGSPAFTALTPIDRPRPTTAPV
ncbi:hypothetical protein AB1Y20_019058 [Prymnesium parvum]|uniref:TNase-like domain-containing protein n=1 Tax=Prymnesium parvum TaxID=97485 RepID=A0AB34JR63_PRYPA